MNIRSIAYFLISLIAAVVILKFCQTLLIPFVFALLLWVIVRKVNHLLNRVGVIRKLPSWLKTIFSSTIIIALIGLLINIVVNSVINLSATYPNYEPNLDKLVASINEMFDIDSMSMLKEYAGDFDFGAMLSSTVTALSDILGNAFMIIIYVLFIFLEESNFQNKLRVIFTNKSQYDQISDTLTKIEISVSEYLVVKTMISLITGFISYIVLTIIGVDSAVFWAFLIFLLNYIPTIGSLLATTFPVIFCLLQFGDYTNALLVLIFVTSIQIVVGNIIEPRLMGNSLNISPLIAIVALTLWGIIWGVMGMILSIPITVIIIIILSQFEKTKDIAIMLSENGKIS